MTIVVVPFAGIGGKTRLDTSGARRRALSLAMLGDVLEACLAVAPTLVATPDAEGADAAREAGAEAVADPGGGQGAAVAAALERATGAVLVVNADLPCLAPADLHALREATPARGLALAPARDGTTNALGLSSPELYAPLYGAGSAGRFRAHAAARGVDAVDVALPNLADDVDTLGDLRRLRLRCGPRTRACLARPIEEALG